MDEACFVRMMKPASGLCDVVRCNRERQRSMLANQRLHVGTIDMLHHHVVRVLVVVDVVHADNVGVIQRGDGFGLASKALKVAVVTEFRLRKHLDCPLVLHHHMFSEIDTAHSTGTQVAEDFVIAEKESFGLPLQNFFALPASH